MKILTVIYSLGKGGTERAAQNFAVGYAKIDHDSRVLFTAADGVRRNELAATDIPVYNFLLQEDLDKIAAWQPDIVHIHSHGVTSHVFGEIKKICPDARYIETNVFARPSPWSDEIDISFQLSAWCEWMYKKRSGNSKSRTAIVPNPVDTVSFQRSSIERINEFRNRYGIKEDHVLIGRVGQKSKYKWSRSLIDIFDRLRKSDDRLRLLVVNPPEIIQSRIENSPFISDIVIIDEIIGDNGLADCYSSIDIFVLISDLGESFGMVIAESLLCETPVITVATPWVDNSQGEVVGNQIGGYVAANLKDVPELIKKLINDKALRDTLGKKGRDRIIQLFEARKVSSDALMLAASHTNKIRFRGPFQLMVDCEGEPNLLSKLILKSGKFFPILRFTMGFTKIREIPHLIVNWLRKRLFSMQDE